MFSPPWYLSDSARATWKQYTLLYGVPQYRAPSFWVWTRAPMEAWHACGIDPEDAWACTAWKSGPCAAKAGLACVPPYVQDGSYGPMKALAPGATYDLVLDPAADPALLRFRKEVSSLPAALTVTGALVAGALILWATR